MNPSDTYRRRIAEHRCVDCGVKLRPDATTRDCDECGSIRRNGSPSRAAVVALRDSLIAQIIETCKTLSTHEQAERLGVSTERIRQLKCKARRLGYDVPREIGGVKRGALPALESPRWRELEASQARCRCGLLLPCESCLPTAAELAISRPGPREAGLYTMKHPRSA